MDSCDVTGQQCHV